jgi:hypothetical protein
MMMENFEADRGYVTDKWEMADLTVRSNSDESSGLKSRSGSCPCAPIA